MPLSPPPYLLSETVFALSWNSSLCLSPQISPIITDFTDLSVLINPNLCHLCFLLSYCCGKRKSTMSPLRKQGSRAKNWIPASAGMTNTVSATNTTYLRNIVLGHFSLKGIAVHQRRPYRQRPVQFRACIPPVFCRPRPKPHAAKRPFSRQGP